MKTHLFVLATILPLSNLISQNEHQPFTFELAGSMSYNSSNSVYPDWIGQTIRTQTIVVQPSVGYFLTDGFEGLLDLHFVYSSVGTEGWNETSDQEIGFRIGVAYNFRLSSIMTAMLGTKIGVGWSYNQRYSFAQYYDSQWTPPQLSFPVYVAGTRFFLSDSSALLVQVEYSRTNNYRVAPFYGGENHALTFGFGFSIFL